MGESYRHGRNGRKEVIKNNDYVIVCINWIRQRRETIGELLENIIRKNTATVRNFQFYVTGAAEYEEKKEKNTKMISRQKQIQLINGPNKSVRESS